MSGLHFFDLPTELIIKTLTELSVVDLRNCEATNNRFLSGLIRDSASLQYGVEKKLACIDDTPYSLWNNSLVDRARNLRLRRRAWLEFSCIHTRSITVDHAATSLYELESDIYFLAGVGGRVSGLSNAIKYVHIPASEVPKGTGSDWEHLEIGRPVVDFAAAIDAHNLMAVVTYTPHRSDNYMLSVDIVLVDFSTRKHHQLARKPVIHVHDVETFRNVPGTVIDIAGDHLLLAIIYDDEAKDLNLLYIFDWKFGIPRMASIDPVAISDTGATFLAEDTILLPNGKGNSLDVYRIPRTGEAAIQIHSFHLPPLMPSYCVTSAICKDSPTCSQATSATRRRYTSDFEKSLVVVSFDITVDDDDEGEQFLFVFLRNEFMDMLEDRTNTGHSSTEWPLWGRSLTRWLDMSGTNYHMSHGRRFVWISNEGDDLQPIYVLDFNPDAVTLAREMNTISPTAAIHVVPRHEVKITRYHAFQGLVESTLPYVETVSREDFTYHSVAINEDNILGFKFTDSDDFAVKSIDVLQFGPL
ncbi:hypothetical protein DFH06DRAFT_1341938 [Mycena polygramma]|nr:hypothetical protein DFH06DRAFT_1341938 [Mycena polygramma]